MSDESKKPESGQPEPSPTTARSAVRKGRWIVAAAIACCLAWNLLADRYTPSTSQARLQAYVVGVAPKVAGLVTEVWVTNNQTVTEGQKLFQIDRSKYEIALARGRSDLSTANRQADAGTASVAAARADLLAAKANEVKAEKDTSRLTKLRDEDPGTISVRRLEVSRASLDSARAKVTAAEAAITSAVEQMGGEDKASNAKIEAAQSAVNQAQWDLDNTTVTASTSGVVTDLRAEVGRYAGAGSPVLTLISMHDVWVEAQFTENNLGHMRVGSEVEIAFDVWPGGVFEGRVRSLGMGVGTGQAPPPAGTLPVIPNNRDWLRQAQRFPVIIEFDVMQEEGLSEQLRIGGQATVIAYSEGHPVLEALGKLYIRLTSLMSYAY